MKISQREAVRKGPWRRLPACESARNTTGWKPIPRSNATSRIASECGNFMVLLFGDWRVASVLDPMATSSQQLRTAQLVLVDQAKKCDVRNVGGVAAAQVGCASGEFVHPLEVRLVASRVLARGL